MKHFIRIIILGFPLVFLMSCKKEDAGKNLQNDTLNYLEHNNLSRSYILHVPPGYPADASLPLVVVLHGFSATAQNMYEWIHMNEKADEEGFIVAYPNGLAYPWDARNPQAWNCGGPFENWTLQTDDVGFIEKVMDEIASSYPLDANRIYVTGHSNGSWMTHRLGMELSHKIAAIAPVSGQSIFNQAPEYPISVLHMHALNDEAVPYEGKHAWDDGLNYESVDSVLTRWSYYYGCNSDPDTIFQNDDYLIKNWACEDANVDILSYVMYDGAHQWFTLENSGVAGTDVIWDFFESHPKAPR